MSVYSSESVASPRQPGGPTSLSPAVAVQELQNLARLLVSAGVDPGLTPEIARLRNKSTVHGRLLVVLLFPPGKQRSAILEALGAQDGGSSTLTGWTSNAEVYQRPDVKIEWIQAQLVHDITLVCADPNQLSATCLSWLLFDANLVAGDTRYAATSACRVQPDRLHGLMVELAQTPSLCESICARTLLAQARWVGLGYEHACEQLNRSLRFRKLRDEVRAKQIEIALATDTSRQDAEKNKSTIDNVCNDALRLLQETGKMTYSADSPLVGSLRASVSKISAANMLRMASSAPDMDKVRVDDRTHAALLEQLRQHVRAGLKSDFQSYTSAAASADVVMPVSRVGSANNTGAFVAEASFLENFSPLITMENAFNSEIPRPSFLSHLASGKQIIFSMMSILTLVGLLFQANWRQHYWVVLVMFAVFLGSVVWSVKNSKKAMISLLDQQADRARENLQREVKRLVSDIGRERGTRLQQLFESLRRDLLKRLDETTAVQLRSRNEVLQRQRGELRERLRVVDMQLRELGNAASTASRTGMQLQNALRDSERALIGANGLDARSEL